MNKLMTVSLLAAVAGCASVNLKPASDRCVETPAVPNAAPSLLPGGRDFKLVWHDEFDGDKLDDSKWGYRTNFWGKRAHWFAAPEDNAVEVKGGCVHLKIVKRADGQFVTPQLQTGELLWDMPVDQNRKGFWPYGKREPAKYLHCYGYYECRCRLQQMPDWWSAFWMQTETQGCSLSPERVGIEHDIMESFVPGEIIPHMFHLNGYGADYRNFSVPRRRPGESYKDWHARSTIKLDKTQFHVFGLLWEPDGYTLYVDGKQHGEKVGMGEGEAISRIPQFLLISTEAKHFRENRSTGKAAPGLEAAAKAGDDFVVDYVRVWDVVR